MPKGSPWVPNAMLQHAQKNWEAPTHAGGANTFRRGPKCQTWSRQRQIGYVCPRETEIMAIHSFNICPKAPHGSQTQCCNMGRRIGKHQHMLEEQTPFEEGQSDKA